MSFWSDEARQALTAAVRDIESHTAAEVVVSVRARSGEYAHVDVAMGATVALGVLCFFLYSPEPYDWTFLPLELVVVFVMGALFSRLVESFRRLWVLPSTKRRNVQQAARATFVERGIDRTQRRTGLLVYVSLFEQKVELVADRGVPRAFVDRDWPPVQRELEKAVAKLNGLNAFRETLLRLGPLLEKLLPRKEDDINELPDEVA